MSTSRQDLNNALDRYREALTDSALEQLATGAAFGDAATAAEATEILEAIERINRTDVGPTERFVSKLTFASDRLEAFTARHTTQEP